MTAGSARLPLCRSGLLPDFVINCYHRLIICRINAAAPADAGAGSEKSATFPDHASAQLTALR
jgi:hypothetical protein